MNTNKNVPNKNITPSLSFFIFGHLYGVFLSLLNIFASIPVKCVLLVPTFLKMQQRTLDLNKCIFIIKNYYAMTSYKHGKKDGKQASKHMNVLKFKVDILNNCKTKYV